MPLDPITHVYPRTLEQAFGPGAFLTTVDDSFYSVLEDLTPYAAVALLIFGLGVLMVSLWSV